MLRFRTLGAVDLARTGDHEVPSVLTHMKCVALRSYLAVAEPHGPHRRDKLLALLWPECDTARARASLRRAIHLLRHWLGADALRGHGAGEVALDRDGTWCDVVAFRHASRAGDVDSALALYQGRFLDGFFLANAPEFEAWVEGERARLSRTQSRLLEQRAERLESSAEYADAVECWSRLVEQDPLNGRAVLRLMRALEAGGDRARALVEARRHARALATELGAAPDPAVEALAARIRGAP